MEFHNGTHNFIQLKKLKMETENENQRNKVKKKVNCGQLSVDR